ncbi:hypothetical protein QZH41_018865 [Actinostola sp. cb2023]|nr:hypothetical protein QZH41_018865 [Actinostola sp. cb2023]
MDSNQSEFLSSFSSEDTYFSAEESLDDSSESISGISDIETYSYHEELEPIATEQEVEEYEAQLTAEQQLEEEYNQRFSGETDLRSWCKCSHCSVDLIVKPEECVCCLEVDRCCEKNEVTGAGADACITEHPGFRSVCLDKWVLETAAIGLKTRQNRSYTVLFNQGVKTEAE